jgi:putative phage-type endonuclease
VNDIIQGSPEWKQARCGSLGASRVADAIARTKTGWGASRENLMAEIVVERLTDTPTEGFMNDAMRWGSEKEPDARAAYEFRFDAEVSLVGLVTHPTIFGTHASPDGLIGDDGLLEIKCPQSATHMNTLLTKKVPGKYITQIQWQLCCTNRRWCDYLSFDPRFPESMQLFVTRIRRDDNLIHDLETQVIEFIAEMDRKLAELNSAYAKKAAA